MEATFELLLDKSQLMLADPSSQNSELSDGEINSIVQGVKPAATIKQTQFGVRKFTEWVSRRNNVNVPLEESSPEEIAKALRKFYVEVSSRTAAK